MRDLMYSMGRIRTIIYGLFPQTHSLCVNYLKSNTKIIEGLIDVSLMTGEIKKITIKFDLIKDELNIQEVKNGK